MRIAYLTNRYPAVSHSFIRREILGLEAMGAQVTRVTVRTPAADLPDEQDRAERDRTVSILGQGTAAVLGRLLLQILMRPLASGKVLMLALRMAGASPRRLVRHLAYFAEAAWLSRHLRRRGVEHLHAHFGTNPAAVARMVHQLEGIPFSFTVHGPDEFDDPLGFDLAGKIADAKLVAAISSFGRSQLMRWSRPEHWHKISVVRCGVDAAFLDAPPNAPVEKPALCSVARLNAQKGLPLLIEAATLLKARGVRFTVTIIGDGELREPLRAQIAKLGLQAEVILAGASDAAGVRAALTAARAFVLPSFAEGLPVVLMEALALGRPVVTTHIAGIPELVDQRCGWLIPPGSVEKLADAMEAALAAPAEQLAEMGEIGRARVREMHDAAVNAGRLLELIRGPAA